MTAPIAADPRGSNIQWPACGVDGGATAVAAGLPDEGIRSPPGRSAQAHAHCPRRPAGLLLSVCSDATFDAQDVKLSASGDTLYVIARNGNVSRNFCSSLGGDVARTEARLGVRGGQPQLGIGRVMGCYTARHVIVCAEDDQRCLVHEEPHRDEGSFHP